MSRKGDKDGLVDVSDRIGQQTEGYMPPASFKPKRAYADSKLEPAEMRNEIEDIYAQGMSKLYDKEEMEFQKLNALMKQIAIEEE